MKTFSKLISGAVAGLVLGAALIACGGTAHAGTSIAVVNATGDKVSGTDAIVWARKDTLSGNRVRVKMIGGVESYIEDDASWSKFAKVKAGFFVPVTVPTASDGLTYDISKARDIACSGGNSTVTFSTFYATDSVADSCAFFNAAKAAASGL